MKKDIVVVSLFDGLSGGRIALDRVEHLNVLRYYSSEIDKFAIQVANANYPQDTSYRLGSVVDIDVEKLRQEILSEFGQVEVLLIGGSPCFVGSTKVITSEGYKDIDSIKVGDKVMTHTNRFNKVLEVGSKLSDTLKVYAQGIKPTTTTPEHPYYVREMNRVKCKTSGKTVRHFGKPFWKDAKDLEKGDFVGTPINKEACNDLSITEEECYILGRYIADGHTRKDYRTEKNRTKDRHWQLILSIGKNKLNNFESNISENRFSSYSHAKEVQRIVFSNKRLVEIAEKYCGSGAINKVISQKLLDLPKKLLEKVLEGYLEGDGSVKDGVYRATSISEELILSLSQAVAKVYQVNSSYEYVKRPKTTIIEGRVVNQRDTFTITFRKEMKKQSNAKVIGDIVWLPFKKIEYTGKRELVYNMEVEIDNSYTANNAIVHNCQGFSMAGKLKGSSTKCGQDVTSLEQYLMLKGQGFEFDGQSYLFWEYIRIREGLQPKYFMLENVRVTKKWLPMFNEAMGMEGILINSNLVSAQDRPRYYWGNFKITLPKDKGIRLSDILEDEEILKPLSPYMSKEFNGVSRLKKGIFNFTERDKGVCQTTGSGHGCKYLIKGSPDNALAQRKLTPLEQERLQTLPDNYTAHTTTGHREHMIGNGWTVDVMAHIFRSIGRED